MDDAIESVRLFYNTAPEKEWDRLDRHRFEFPVTMHHLGRYLKPSSDILDVGGGPGRYSIELAAMGHRVTLFDLSDGNIQLAEKKASERGVRLEGFRVGTATDLSAFAGESFDAVVCFGPMYHLLGEKQRSTAVLECLRVLRPGGLLAVAFVSCYAPISDALMKNPDWIHDMRSTLSKCRESRVHLSSKEDVFTDAYYIEPYEIPELMSRFPVKECTLIGAEGLMIQSESSIIRCGEKTTQAWISLAIEIAETNAALGSSIHLVYFGRKTEEPPDPPGE